LIVSGVYLWWPKGTPFWHSLRMTGGTRRLAWRDVHKTTGAILAPVLAYYLISGLAWTDVWGGKFVQSWSTLSAAQAPPGESQAHAHEALNAGSGKVVPWNLEQAPLPSSSPDTGQGRITLDAAIAVAQREGIGHRFWVGVPSGVDGVWTIAQTAMNKDVIDPAQELTVHVDQHTGAVVGRGGWSDYGLMARAMAAGIPLHMGSLGWWNLIGASVVCLSVITLSLSGLVMWWLRRPARRWRLAAPPRPDPTRVPLVTWATAVTLGVLFPLAGATLVAVAILDWTLVRRLPALRQLLD
ncbi:MAG TPA: PepSY domain-containing protein, partial [Vicinamibacterales bacterium]